MRNINIVKEFEEILQQTNFMGTKDKTGVNLAVNQILNRIEELDFEIVAKSDIINLRRQISDQSDIINNYRELINK